MLEIFLDIETLPCTDPELLAMLYEAIKPPANYSKPETITKWDIEERPKMKAEVLKKTALDGTYGRVGCITFAFDNEPVQGFIDRDETVVLTSFFNAVSTRVKAKQGTVPTIIGHNVRDFDLKFLWKRSIIQGIKPCIALPWNSKPYSEQVRDTMSMWDSATDKRISLHKLCKVLGIPSPKDIAGFTGADVYKLWQLRQYSKILEYGKLDTDATRKCYRKIAI